MEEPLEEVSQSVVDNALFSSIVYLGVMVDRLGGSVTISKQDVERIVKLPNWEQRLIIESDEESKSIKFTFDKE